MGHVSANVQIAVIKVCDLVGKKMRCRDSRYDQALWEANMALYEAHESQVN